MSKKDKLNKYFTKLIQIDSPSGSEQEISQYLNSWLLEKDFKTQIDKVGNLFASKNVTKENKSSLLLCAHMDTVQPGIGIKPFLINGVYQSISSTILGADNKASIASIMVAVEAFYKEEKNKDHPLEILFTVREETGGGVDNFDFSKISAKKILICDYAKPIGTIALGAPFIQNFRIEFIGKASHSSKPVDGVNSFTGLTELLKKIKVGSLDYGYTTINIGKIDGGSGVNTIPEKCVISGEVRSFKEVLFNKHMSRIKSTSKKIAKDNNLKIIFSVDGYCPGYLYSENDGHIVDAAKIINSVTNKEVFFEKTFGVSDANILAAEGFETILISDGVKDPHTTKESIAVKDMVLLKEIVLEFLKKS